MSVITANEEQLKFWDGPDGTHWAEHEERYDASVSRYMPRFFDVGRIEPHERVVDIGCGNGETSCQAATLAREGAVLGVDLSAAMVERARRRAKASGLTNVTFQQADAQVVPFDEGNFDLVMSRTGAMFFADPVAAFTNISRGLRRNGRVTLLAWQELKRNEWLIALREALAMGRTLPAPPVSAPGPFGLADPAFVRTVLEKSGLTEVSLESVDQPFMFGTDADNAFAFVTSLGFTRAMLVPLTLEQQDDALQALQKVMTAHDTGDGVCFGSSAWLITAVKQ